MRKDAKSDRLLGNANYEVAFGGKVYLFDTYYDRAARSRPIGFAAADVRVADVILLSHAHFDHMSDIVPVARQTGAKVVGAPITIETAVKFGLPAQQAIIAKGGETLHLGDLTVEIALARHSTIQDGLIDAYANLYKTETRPDTPEEAAHSKEVGARGTGWSCQARRAAWETACSIGTRFLRSSAAETSSVAASSA